MQQATYQDRLQARIYRLLQSRLDSGRYDQDTRTSIRLSYELGLIIGLVTQLAAEDSLVRDRLEWILAQHNDPAVKD
jgi:hypothetical protein